MNKNMTLASYFTFVRLLLIFPICEAIALQAWTQAFWYTVFAGFTDVLDGFFARYFNRETDFGAFFDAFVDKILMSAVVWTLLTSMQLLFPFRMLGISIIVKEVMQLIASSYLFMKSRLPTVRPSWLGKASMCGQLVFVLFLMLNIECDYIFSACFVTPVFVLLFASALSYGTLFMKLIK